MIGERAGAFRDGDRLTVVAYDVRGDRLEYFVVDGADDPEALTAELRTNRVRSRRIRVGLDRAMATVKSFDLPRAGGAEIDRMVAFELDRQVPFRPEEMRSDWVELPSEPDAPHRVLIAACERRTVDRAIRSLSGSRYRPAAVTVACHDLPALLPRLLPSGHTVWAHRQQDRADLLLLDGRVLLMSRRIVADDPMRLAHEIQRTLALVGWRRCDRLWVSGDGAADWREARPLNESVGAPAGAPPYRDDHAARIAGLPVDAQGAGLLALAVAAGSRRPVLNLLPPEQRPRTLSLIQALALGTVAVTALLGTSLVLVREHKAEGYLGRLSTEIRRLEPEARTTEALADELGRKKRLIAALRSIREGRIQALEVLTDLTETVPAGAWLQFLSMDRDGVELSGQADAASQLIPLLEASRWLERVEFTSPVTKSQGKEQFKIRAAWETPGSGKVPGAR